MCNAIGRNASATGYSTYTYTSEEGINTSVHAATTDGLKFNHSIEDRDFEMVVKVEASAGLGVECAISFLGKDLIDPGVKISPLTVSAEILDKNKEFENYPACVELGIRGIDMEITIEYGDDSVVTEILNAINAELSLTWSIFDSSDDPLYDLKVHIEKDLNGKLSIAEQCTRGGTFGHGGGESDKESGGFFDSIFGFASDMLDAETIEKIENGELTDEELEELIYALLEYYEDDIDKAAAGCLGCY